MAKAKDAEKKENLRVQSQRIKGLSHDEHFLLRQMCAFSNNLYNVALYSIRQHFFATGKYLRYEANYHACKGNENYKLLQAGAAQQTMMLVDRAMKSFFELLRMKREGKYDKVVRLPRYQPKGGLLTLTLSTNAITIRDGRLRLPMSRTFTKLYGRAEVSIRVPANLLGREIREVRIVPLCGGKFFRADFVYETERQPEELDHGEALSIDIGTENLAACVTTAGASFIMDGRKLKSINQAWNKRKAVLQSVADKQAHGRKHGPGPKEAALTGRRNRRTADILNKAARYIVGYCITHGIGTIVCGRNKGQKQRIRIGRRCNQAFVQIGFLHFRKQLEALCWKHGIRYVETEESYTSKASFLDGDGIPVYDPAHKGGYRFSGKRVRRGLYRSADGRLMNADLNGAANILSKSGIPFDRDAVCRAVLSSPRRIRVA